MRKAAELALAALGGAIATLILLQNRRKNEVEEEGKRLPKDSNGERISGRYCAGMIKAKPGMLEQYMQLHDATWVEVIVALCCQWVKRKGTS